MRSALGAGVVSPTLLVLKPIERPGVRRRATAAEGSEPWVQSPEVIEKMRIAGRIAAGFRRGRQGCRAGGDHRRIPTVRPQPWSITAPTRRHWATGDFQVPLHLAQRDHLPRDPGPTVISDGDIVNIDVTAYIHGGAMATPTPRSFAGDVSEEHRLLVERH